MEPIARWGPRIWKTLEQAAANYPEQPSAAKKQEAKMLLIGLPSLLPCDECAGHLRSEIIELGLAGMTITQAIQNRNTFFQYVWLLHEKVNARLGKRGMTLQQVKTKYGM